MGNIKWRKKDLERLGKTIRTFNSKITRTKNKNSIAESYLPSKVVKNDLMSTIKTRQDFNRVVNSLQRFTKKGMEMPVQNVQGLTITKWKKREIEIGIRTVNSKRTKERNKVDISSSLGNTSLLKSGNLNKRMYSFDDLSVDNFNKFSDTLENQMMSRYNADKMEQYKENYLKAYKKVFGEYGKESYDKISQIPADKLVDLLYLDPVFQLAFIYDEYALSSRLIMIEEYFEKYKVF